MSVHHYAAVETASGIFSIFRGVHNAFDLWLLLGLFGAFILLILGAAAFEALRKRFGSGVGASSDDESPDTSSQSSQSR
ncbi:hypothetical protein [Streptomyces sp. YGL11-2]|uniref:hypothetical protein n=1 Tax=Streptomyces sp. YGL11-2 TaxID=3414028 RepID=UPI003CFA9362